MPSALKKTLLLVGATLLLAAGLMFALASTQGGTRLLAKQVRSWAGDGLTWEHLQGELLGPLQLQGVSFRQPGLSFEAELLQLEWRPGALLRGRLEVGLLRAEGLSIVLADTGEQPEPAGPFQLTDLKPPLDFALRDVQVNNLQLVMGDRPAQVIDRISLAAYLDDDRLRLEQLSVRAPQGGLAIRGSAGFDAKSPVDLELDWRWRLPDGRPIGGRLRAGGDSHRLAIEHRGSGDLPVSLKGEFRDLLDVPAWKLRLDWSELALTAAEAPLVLRPGHVESEGNLEDYRLAGEGEVLGLGADPLSWSLQASGDSGELQLSLLKLAYAPGELALSGLLDWRDPVSFDLQYRASGSRLSELNPDLPEQLDAQGNLRGSYTGETLALEILDLALIQSPLRLALNGRLRLPPVGEPAFDGNLRWSALQWPLMAMEPSLASPGGRLEGAGTAANYTVELTASTAGSQVPPVEWRGQASGNRGGLVLHSLRADLLGGELELSGPLGWDPVPTWAVQVQGRELDPGRWLPDLPGRLSLALSTSGQIDPDTGPRANLELAHLSGLIAERDLKLAARAQLAADTVVLEALRLDSGTNLFNARGQLSLESLDLDWQLQLPAPGDLLPGSTGRLSGSGRLEGSPAQPRLQARLQGRELGFDALSLASLEADLQTGLGTDEPLRLDLQLGPLSDSEQLLLESANLRVSGTTARHALELTLQGPGERLQGRLQGGLDPALSQWGGELTQLDAETTALGAWQLAGDGQLALSGSDAQLGDICLRPVDDSGRICVSGHWSGTGGSSVAGRLDSLSIQRLLPGISGELNGNLDAGLDSTGALRTRARLDLGEGQIAVPGERGVPPLAHGGGELVLAIGPGGLDAGLEFAGPQDGHLQAGVKLPKLDRLPLAPTQPLAGQVRASLPDLGGLAALVPVLSSSAGRLDADLDLAGSLDKPMLNGQVSLAGGAADLPQAGLQLRNIELRAASDPARPGAMLLRGGLASGPGRVDLTGRLDLPDMELALELKGERLQIYNTPDGRALASPDLQISWSDEVLRLRGRVLIPEAAITPRLALNPGMASGGPAAEPSPGQLITPSPDVVVLEEADGTERAAQLASTFRVDSEVELVLGDEVPVNALGFISRITGGATFTNDPRQADLIPSARGRLSFDEGTFRAFGQDLEIETGQIIFPGGPVNEPDLVVRAVRWIDNDPQVTAVGVMVAGPIDNPVVELFSRPQLEPSEIQSYLLTGRSSGTRDDVLSIGTYLHPRFYAGYGYNLLEKTSEFNGLFTITPRYGVGAGVGEADNNVHLTFTHEH